MRLSPNHLMKIQTLLESSFVLSNIFGAKDLKAYLLSIQAIKEEGRPKIIKVINEERIFNILRQQFKINTLEDIKQYIIKSSSPQTKDEIVENNNSTKARSDTKSFGGLMITSFNPLDVIINDVNVKLYPIEGTSTFIHSVSTLKLPEDIIVVGVENPETLWYIKRYEHLFDTSKKYLFLLIKNINTSFERTWLETLQNEYLHFGDYDLAAISIYINEIIPRLKMCKKYAYFKNDKIYSYTKNNSTRELYSKQANKYKNLKSDDAEVQELINHIRNNKRSLEQEKLSKKI